MEWLEAEGESVDDAVQAALAELGLQSADQVEIEVLREPKKGFLGLGSQLALVKVTRKPSGRRRRRRRSKSSSRTAQPDQSAKGTPADTDRRRQEKGRGNGSRDREPAAGGGRAATRSRSKDRNERASRQKGSDSKRSSQSKRPAMEAAVSESKGPEREAATIEEQAEVAVEFLKGLVDAFGLDGEVTSRIDEDILYLNVDGDTEALVGSRGTIMQSVLELTRTVVQRKTYGAPRMRIDIAGYAERRREALTIYAGRLAEQVKEEGGEVMLEPMNPADRKVVHDAIAAIEGVRSFSEGEDPNRSVVVAPAQ